MFWFSTCLLYHKFGGFAKGFGGTFQYKEGGALGTDGSLGLPNVAFLEDFAVLWQKVYISMRWKKCAMFSNLFQGLAEFFAGGVAAIWPGAGTLLHDFCQFARKPSIPMADGILSAWKPAGVFSG